MRLVGESRSDAVLYIRGHEGRGIGLGNKVAAYELQDQGLDTVEANSMLGFREYARDYRDDAEMIQTLGFSDIRLLTNNPQKGAALRRYGVRVRADIPLVLPSNPYNAAYLTTKRDKMGHRLPLAEDDHSAESGMVSFSALAKNRSPFRPTLAKSTAPVLVFCQSPAEIADACRNRCEPLVLA